MAVGQTAIGRPTDYNDQVASRLLSEIAEGKSVASLCKQDWAPSRQTFYLWIHTHRTFADSYAKAKDDCAESLADEIIDIADNGSNDWMDVNDPENPGYRFNSEHYQRSRLRVDTRKWVASKLKPKKYGEKTEVEHSGSVNQSTPEQIMETLVQQAAAMPTKAYQIRKWLKECLSRIPALEGE